MEQRYDIPGKIEVHGNGLGTVTREMIVQRAREIAASDGRKEPHEGDLDEAYAELVGAAEPHAPEEGDALANVTRWDESPEDHGHQAPDLLPGQEEASAERLVRDGLEEADHERRVAAAREFLPEPEDEDDEVA